MNTRELILKSRITTPFEEPVVVVIIRDSIDKYPHPIFQPKLDPQMVNQKTITSSKDHEDDDLIRPNRPIPIAGDQSLMKSKSPESC